jgi:hypothetical protein
MKYVAAFWLVGLVGLSYMAIQEVKATYDSTSKYLLFQLLIISIILVVITPRNIYDYKSSVDGVEVSDLPVVSLKPRSSKTVTTGSSATSSSSSGGSVRVK